MDEFRRGTGGRGAEVAPVDERDAEARAGRLRGYARADDAAADDEQVEVALGELLERRAAPAQIQSGFVQAFPPFQSATSIRP
jgi:hypothetical protein